MTKTCLNCKTQMTETSDLIIGSLKEGVIDWVMYKCPKCGEVRTFRRDLKIIETEIRKEVSIASNGKNETRTIKRLNR